MAIRQLVDTFRSEFVNRGVTPFPPGSGWDEDDGQSKTGTQTKKAGILIIEDNQGDVFLIKEALQEHKVDCGVVVLSNGELANQYFDQIDQDMETCCPQLVLLDLNLPKLSGHKVLERIRRSVRCAEVPIVIVTSSESEFDLAENRRLGATAYFQKSTNLEAFMKLGALVKFLISTPSKGGTQA